MWKNIGLEQCLAFINCQLSPERWGGGDRPVKPAITISRMTGSGGRSVAGILAEYLQSKVPGHAPWTVFDRTLVEQVVAEHHLPKRVAEHMPEKHKSMLADIFEELFGLHPSSWTLVHHTAETILHLAELGHVILVGRGANVITRNLPNAFHVRLVGSLERRAEQTQKVYGFDRQAALEFIHREDKGRRHYVKEHLHEDVSDPLLYHVVINTDRTRHEDAARLIGDEVIRRFHLDRYVVAETT